MKDQFYTRFGAITVEAEYKGDKNWISAGDTGHDNWNNHKVVVRTKRGRATFEFWCSIMEGTFSKPQQLKDAVSCFVSDAQAGELSFDDFCSEFGYDNDSRKAEKIHKACKKTAKAVARIFSQQQRDYILSMWG